jgi:hypothetical protein
VVIFERIVIGSIFLAGIVVPIGIARAFFHEASVLYARRHALRFGRLFVHLNDGDVTSDQLKDMFSWNMQPSSAFAKIEAEKSAKSPVSIIADLATALAEKLNKK